MLVTYVYQADDDAPAALPPASTKRPHQDGAAPDVKSFSFWTLLPLGTAVPRSTESMRTATSS